jgi:iron complex outermembrane recepter protein
LSVGVRGITKNKWNWDFSNSIGRNKFHFFGDKTFNASLGNTQTHFDDGGFTFLQNTINVNFSKAVDAKTSVAYGAEIRNEQYTIFAGEEASYKNYSSGDKATGSQGFPGYQPNDAVKAKRSVVGGYIDIEKDFTKDFTVDAALRAENYSDFGFTGNFKLATRYKVATGFNIRAIAPNYSSIAKAAGIPTLKQEKSLNAGAGFTWQANKFLNITVDGYYAKIKDRVVLSGQFDGSDPNLDADLRAQMANLNVGLAQFFANAASTTNTGIDLVLDYNQKIGDNKYRVQFAANIQNMKIDKINIPTKLSGSSFLQQTFFSDREQKFLLASAPNAKASLNLEYGMRKITIGARVTYFGKIVLFGYGQDGLGIAPTVPLDNGTGDVPDQYNYKGKIVSDLYASMPLNKNWTLVLGADNFMNTHPDFGVVKGAKDWAYNTETGGAWDAVQMGFSGRRLFARLAFKF